MALLSPIVVEGFQNSPESFVGRGFSRDMKSPILKWL
jgi:hypothetical protein